MDDIKKKLDDLIKEYIAYWLLQRVLGVPVADAKKVSYEIDYDNDEVKFTLPYPECPNWITDVQDIRHILNILKLETKSAGDFFYHCYESVKDGHTYGTSKLDKIYAELIHSAETGDEPILTTDDYSIIIDCIRQVRECQSRKQDNE